MAARLRLLQYLIASAAILILAGDFVSAQESEESGSSPVAPGATCADPWYGGCPDSCTRSFRRLQNRGALTNRALEAWADRCVKSEEQSREQQQRADADQSGGQSGGAESDESAQSAQASEADRSERSDQDTSHMEAEQDAAQSAQADTERTRQGEDRSQSEAQGQAQAQSRSDQAARRGAESGTAAQPQEQAQQSGQSQGVAGESETQRQTTAAPSPSRGGESTQSGVGADALAQAPQQADASGTPQAPGTQPAGGEQQLDPVRESQRAHTGESNDGTESDQTAELLPAARGGGSEAQEREAPQQGVQRATRTEEGDDVGGGRNAGEPQYTPLPRGQGSTGRPFEPLEQALDSLGRRGLGIAERMGMSCGLAAAPMCGGACQAGVCAPSADGGGCRCRPARTPETADHRRRALCTMTGPSRIAVAACRAPDSGGSASCAVSEGAESQLCETLWSVPYQDISVLEGGRADLDLRLDAVPLWDWTRDGEAIDRVSVPLGASGKSVDPKSVWESSEDPLPASDVRLVLGSSSTGEVAILQGTGGGGLRETKTMLRAAQLVSGCDESSDTCPETQLARLRLTLFAQAPEARLLATHTRQGAEWWGECAAARFGERPELLCYQLRSDGSGEARAWRPLRLDWLGEAVAARYVAALMETRDRGTELDRAFFTRAAATQGDAPALLLAFASEQAAHAYAQGQLPPAGGDAEGDPAGMLLLEGDRLIRLTAEQRSELAPRTRAELVGAVDEADGEEDDAAARLAAAAIFDPGMIALARRGDIGACLARSRPQPELACFHVAEESDSADELAVWDPLAWPGGGPQPRHDRAALLAAARAEGAKTGALEDPVLDLVLSAAVAPEGRYLRAFDIYRSLDAGSRLEGEAWAGLILAFKRRESERAPLFSACSEAALFLTERRRTPLAGTLRLVGGNAQGRDCTAAFPDTYATHREEIRHRLAERLPAGIESLGLNKTRALLRTRSPAGATLIEVWSAAPGMDRDFPTVTAQCLMARAEQAADLAPQGERPGQRALEHALLTPDWRALGWRANPLGLVLRAESCEEGV